MNILGTYYIAFCKSYGTKNLSRLKMHPNVTRCMKYVSVVHIKLIKMDLFRFV